MTPSAQTRALLEIAVAFLELCDGLDLGGLTPSLNVVRRVRSAVRIPIHVMVARELEISSTIRMNFCK